MQIAVATDDVRGLETVGSHRFGRSACYALVDAKNASHKRCKMGCQPLLRTNGAPGEVPNFIKSQRV